MDQSIRGIPPLSPQRTVTNVAGSLHDFDNSELHFPVDMDLVIREATASTEPIWKLEITCHATPFKWHGPAKSEGVATLKAMADLSDSYPDFNRYKARVTACVQVAA